MTEDIKEFNLDEEIKDNINEFENEKSETKNNNSNNNNNNRKKESVILEWAKSILIAVVLAFLIKNFIIEPTRIQGNSMLQTLHNEDKILVNKIVMKIKALERGDIVVMEYDKDHDYIKRVVGLPGEYIQLIDGKVFINGEEYKEDYIHGDYTEAINGFEWKLGENEYFVLGDNRTPGGSTDSRVFGPVNLERIKGVASFRFYPFGDGFGFVN